MDRVHDPYSRLDTAATALADLRGIARVRRDLSRGTLASGSRRRGGTAGGPTAWAAGDDFARDRGAEAPAPRRLDRVLRGRRSGAQAAQRLALVVTVVGQDLRQPPGTFGVRGGAGWMRDQPQGSVSVVAAWCSTLGALVVLDLVDRPRLRARWR